MKVTDIAFFNQKRIARKDLKSFLAELENERLGFKVEIHIWGKNKPLLRWFNKNGDYKEYKNANYSGHRIAKTMIDAQAIIEDYLKRDWEVQVSVKLV